LRLCWRHPNRQLLLPNLRPRGTAWNSKPRNSQKASETQFDTESEVENRGGIHDLAEEREQLNFAFAFDPLPWKLWKGMERIKQNPSWLNLTS
jgi:hypothetical protein